MKQLWFLGVFFLILGCQPMKNYQFEDKLLACFYSEQEAKGVDAKAVFDQVELIYIKYGVLQSGEGKSYIKLLQKMTKVGIPNNPDMVAELVQLDALPQSIKCLSMSPTDTIGYTQSAYKKTELLFDFIESEGDIVANDIAGKVLQLFDHQDFKHELFQISMLWAMTSILKNGANGDSLKSPQWIK